MSAQVRAVFLRSALMEMTTRYGSSKQRMAYAEADGRPQEAERFRRASRRQFAAIQRLAYALANLAGGTR